MYRNRQCRFCILTGKWYCARIQEAAIAHGRKETLAERADRGHEYKVPAHQLFGPFEQFVARSKPILQTTLSEFATAEFDAIEFLLRKALGDGGKEGKVNPENRLAITDGSSCD